MTKDVYFLSLDSTYGEAYRLLKRHPFRSYPIVDNKGLMTPGAVVLYILPN
jgi:CBS domain-containing protein